MANLWRDVRFGVRLLWKHKAFTLVAMLALALGIGPNAAIFSVLYATMLEPMPYPHPEQLVMVWSKIQGGRNVVSAPLLNGRSWECFATSSTAAGPLTTSR